MKYLLVLLSIIPSFVHAQLSNDTALFSITENGKIGFINKYGAIIIKPVYLAAGPFSEGLAPARINGNYGYINSEGNFVIEPQYDYAMPFSEGLAIVYIDGKPKFINKSGKSAFDFPFIAAESFMGGRAKLKTASGKVGYIDRNGKLIIDTVYSFISVFNEGLAVVRVLQKDKSGEVQKDDYAIIDSTGKVIVPFGKYKEIDDFVNGYSKVVFPGKDNDSTGFIDRHGALVFVVQKKVIRWIDGSFHCGLAKISLYKKLVTGRKRNQL